MMMKDGLACILLALTIFATEGLRFTVEPDHQVAALLQPLWWHCQAEDDETVTYSWRKDERYLPIRNSQSIYSNGTLHIEKLDVDDVGNYTCIAKSGSQSLSSASAVLDLAYVNPTFTINPESHSVFLGEQVILQCLLESLPVAEITWTRNGQSITTDTVTISAGGESTLTLYPVMYPDTGSYKCEGRNPLLNVVIYSDVGELVVEGPPVFTSSLQSVFVPLGLTATFDCRFDGNPSPTVAWFIHRQHSDGNVTSRQIPNADKSLKYKVYQNGTFQIFDVTQEDVAFYTCRVANSFGEMSDSATLNITGSPTLPSFTVTPSDQSVPLGGNVTFTCQAEGNPSPTVMWLHEGKEMTSVDGTIALADVQTSDAGVYVCVAQNEVGFTNRIANLNVLVAPSFLTVPEDVTILQGSRVQLSCNATGNPAPDISWTTPNSEMISSSLEEDGISVSVDGSLVISNAERKHHGKYTCTATNEVGSVEATCQVVVEAPPVFTVLPISRGILDNERAMFHCQASGYPTPSMYWSKDGEGMITSTAQRQIYMNHTLVIHSVKTRDGGVYRCQAYNTRGSIEAPATLNVIVPPTFTVRPSSQKARVGDDVKLDCISAGDPVPTQKWNKDGRLVVLEENMEVLVNYSLVILEIRANQFGEYVCVASNIADTISSSARIQTEDFPILTIRPSSITVNMSRSARLQCKGQALETPSTRWFRLTQAGTSDVRTNHRVSVTVDGEMVIQNIQASDEGWYQCVVANSVGNVSENAFIKVQEPPSITRTNSPQTTVIYSDVTLTCQSSGDPPPILHWINPVGQEVAAGPAFLILDNTLQIVSANQETDGGNWMCRACNLLGCDEAYIEVRIEGPPFIHSINASETSTSVILDCWTSGEPEPSVIFTYQGQDVTLNFEGHRIVGSMLYIDKDAVMPNYVCVAENRNGEDQEEVSVPGRMPTPSVISSTSREVTMEWSVPVELGNLPLLGYQLEVTSDLGDTWRRSDKLYNSSNGSFTDLNPNTFYQVRVAGVNILGVGIFSDLSETTRTSADAPSQPTNVTAKKKSDSSILLSWEPSQFLNGDIDDIEYRYKVSIPSEVKSSSEEEDVPSGMAGDNQTETVYEAGSVPANTTLHVLIEGLTDSTVYAVSVLAVNIQINKSSEPVTVFADLTLTGVSEPASFSPDAVIGIVFGILGGVILIMVIAFIATQIRHMRKTESLSLVKHKLSLDQFYLEKTKNLYGKKSSRFSMKRSSSQGFYKFDNDESFHGSAAPVSKENGSAHKDKREDGDVLLTAKNPLYDSEFKDLPEDSSKFATNTERGGHQSSCEQAEIEIPRCEIQNNFVLKPAIDGTDVTNHKPRDRLNTDIDDTIETDSDTDLADIYSISKETDDSHIYEIPNLETRSRTSKEKSPSPSSRSSHTKSKPVRVLSLEQLRSSSALNSKQGSSCGKLPESPLDSPTIEKHGDPEQELLNVQEIPESSLGEETDLLPHNGSTTITKRNVSPPKDIRISYDISEKDIKDDVWSAALY